MKTTTYTPPDFNKFFFKKFSDYRFNLAECFDDFLTIFVCCLSRQTQEELYLKTIEKYNKTDLEDFAKLFGIIWVEYLTNVEEKTWSDPLGTLYEEITSRFKSQMLGQFFTPESVCNLMASITANKDEFGQNINDPCCGSGRMLLAHENISKGNYCIGADIDPVCVKMSALNLALHGIKGEIWQGDSNRQQYYKVYIINADYWKTKTPSIITKFIQKI